MNKKIFISVIAGGFLWLALFSSFGPVSYAEEEQFGGIGISLSQIYDPDIENKMGELVVLDVFDGTPAFKHNILAGDIITHIDGEDVTGKEFGYLITKKLRGKTGSNIEITVKRPRVHQPLIFILTREKITYTPEKTEKKTAVSKDGVPISYSVYGQGRTTLVLIHGWSCDSRYWKQQIPYFSKKYQVITIDLAGHGDSGLERNVYSLDGFAEDVKAVIEDINAPKVILIGHSLGGGVIAKAALLMPERVIGLIGVDTLQNIENAMSNEEISEMTASYKKDFPTAVKSLVEEMFVEGTDPQLKEWIIRDMSSAPAAVGISAFQEFVTTFQDGGMAEIFSEINVPVRCVNADLWPTDVEANRRHMASFEAGIINGAGHFPMMEHPEKFNKILERFIKEIEQKD